MKTIAHELIQAMLNYADDVKQVDKQEILDFFKNHNVPHREDYIHFLSQFGGMTTKFFNSIGINCTFRQIQELYIEGHSDNALLPEFAYFGVDDVGILCISKTTGQIYYQEIDENEEPCLGELCFYNIKSFLFISLLYYLNKFSKEKYFKKNITEYEIIDIEKNLSSYFLEDIQDLQMKYYLKDNILYSLNYKMGYIYKHELSMEFFEKLN